MEHYLETLTFAIVLVVLAFLLIGIGWIFTGKQKIKGGTCGRDPSKKKQDSCETQQSCSLCSSKPQKKNQSCDKKKSNDIEEED